MGSEIEVQCPSGDCGEFNYIDQKQGPGTMVIVCQGCSARITVFVEVLVGVVKFERDPTVPTTKETER